jgi:hypothetical protein
MSRSTARRFVGAGLLRRPGTRFQDGAGGATPTPPPPEYPFTIYTDSGYKDVSGTDYAIAVRTFYAS